MINMSDCFNTNNCSGCQALMCACVTVHHSWRVEDWAACSRSCGSGEQIRQVRCVQKTAPDQVHTVTDDQCTQPPPPRRQTCNTHSCPPVWSAGPWSQVSALCQSSVHHTVKPKIIFSIFDIFSLVGAGHYSSFM